MRSESGQRAALAPAPDWLARLVAAVETTPPEVLHPMLTPPADGSGRRAAVLIAFCESERGPAVLLTERSPTMRSHAGQVAFPGGAVEPGDADDAATALREAQEEVGLDPASVAVLGRLQTRYLPPSQFVVTPMLAWWAEPHPVSAVDEGEVARAVVVAIADLVDPRNRFIVRGPRSGVYGVGFEIGDLFVWGFTAGILDGLLRLGGWERAWDRTAVRALPAALAGPVPGTTPGATEGANPGSTPGLNSGGTA